MPPIWISKHLGWQNQNIAKPSPKKWWTSGLARRSAPDYSGMFLFFYFFSVEAFGYLFTIQVLDAEPLSAKPGRSRGAARGTDGVARTPRMQQPSRQRFAGNTCFHLVLFQAASHMPAWRMCELGHSNLCREVEGHSARGFRFSDCSRRLKN